MAAQAINNFFRDFAPASPPKGHIPWECLTSETSVQAFPQRVLRGRYGPEREFEGSALNVPREIFSSSITPASLFPPAER